jgi:hypothetical protein
MSTISDALKKRRDEEDEPSKETAGPRVVEVHVPKDHTARTTLLAVVLGVVVLTGAAIGGYVVLGRIGAFDRPPAPQPTRTESHPQTPPGPTEAVTETGPPVQETAPEARLKLEGIFSDPIDPRAVINGRTLKLGGTVEGFTLVVVEEDRVVLERQGRRYELTLE